MSSLMVTDCEFIGGVYALWISGGSSMISDSYFELNTVPIEVFYGDSVQITNCEFKNLGLFSGPYSEWWYDSGIRLVESENIEISNNSVSGYNPEGLMVFHDCANITLSANSFRIDTDGLLYDADPLAVGFESYFAAVDFKLCDTVYVTDNVFTVNEVDSATPWLYFKYGLGTTCLTGNRLTLSNIGKLDVTLKSGRLLI